MSDDKKPKASPFAEAVATSLIDQIKNGTAPWQRPWNREHQSGLPMNPVTGNRYKGINLVHLMSQPFQDNRWMTFKQADSIGAQVRKGSRGTPIQFWKTHEEKPKLDANGKPMKDADGNTIKVSVKLEYPIVRNAYVFNAEQIDGLPERTQAAERTWDPIERAEKIIAASGANIAHDQVGRAFYRPSTDSIHLPGKGDFDTPGLYYSTALHEIGHWTGHESRLDRDIGRHPFGTPEYAKEELRAEIASMIISEELGIERDTSQHASYIDSWVQVLEKDNTEIFRAAAEAEKIRDYLLALEKNQEQIAQQETQETREAEPVISTNAIAVEDAALQPPQAEKSPDTLRLEAREMVAAADADGAWRVQLDGPEEFKREAWLEASQRGMQTEGYTPTPEDQKALDARLQSRAQESEAKAADEPAFIVRDDERDQATPSPEASTNEVSNGEASMSVDPEKSKDLDDILGQKYLRVGNKYHLIADPKDPAFIDKGNAFTTTQNSLTVARDIVRAADQRGWSKLQVKGSEDFRREVWLQAAQRGIDVTGYKPNDADKALVEKQRLESQAREDALKARAEESKNKANAFRSTPREDALKKHPDLLPAYALMRAADEVAKSRITNPEGRKAFLDTFRATLASKLEAGEKIPEVKLKERLREKRQESEMVR